MKRDLRSSARRWAVCIGMAAIPVSASAADVSYYREIRPLLQRNCQGCHQPEEFGDGAYLEGWSGLPIHDLIEHIRTTMPQDNPGSLKRKDYVDVAAYLLKINGLPEGASEMDTASVKLILIEGPYRPSGGSQ